MLRFGVSLVDVELQRLKVFKGDTGPWGLCCQEWSRLARESLSRELVGHIHILDSEFGMRPFGQVLKTGLFKLFVNTLRKLFYIDG